MSVSWKSAHEKRNARLGCYAGEEALDERLLLLRFVQDLPRLLLITLAGCILLGGLYVLVKIVFAPPTQYEAVSDLLTTFTNKYEKEGDYYVNDYTWNTYLASDVFYEKFTAELGSEAVSRERLTEMAEISLVSDLHIPRITVTGEDPQEAQKICDVIVTILTGNFPESMEGVTEVRVLTAPVTSEKDRDVRPVRAFLLAAVITGFFAVVIWLFRELSADSIYLPVTLRNRYGLPSAGSMGSSELSENISHLLKDKKSIAVTTATAQIDPALIAAMIRDLFPDNISVQAYPDPLLAEGTAECLQETDGIILAVPGGPASGKPLERTLEFLKCQGISVDAAILCDADEDLIRRYYRIGETN